MSRTSLKRTVWYASVVALLVAPPSYAADLGYGGRLVDDSGVPLAGPVALTLRFFGSAAGSDQLGPTKTFPAISLTDGVFQLTINLDDAEQAAILGNGSTSVYVEIEAQGTVYPRQRFAAVPLALRVPIDNSTLVYGADAKLAIGEIPMSQVSGLESALAQKLESSLAGSTVTAGTFTTAGQDGVVIKPYGAQAGETGELRFEGTTGSHYVGFKAPDTVAADQVWTLPAADGASGEVLSTDGAGGLSWVALSGANILDGTIVDTKLATIATPGKVSGAAITSGTIGGTAAFTGTGGVATSGHVVVSSTGAAATELRFEDDNATHYVGFKAPATVAANKVWTLPASDGTAGQLLKTNGAGVLSWSSVAGGDMIASSNLSDLASVATARTNLGLGSLATANEVGSAEITDGAIANTDISGTAAVATSKLSGPVTSIAGHGLGALATASSVTSAAIDDSTIVDADISGAAAIATSKLSGPVTSIASHGLGALATASSVTSATITDSTIVDADISGTAAISSSKISFAADSVSGNAIDGGTISNFASTGIDDNATATAITLNSSGNVGIGSTAPALNLDISGSSATSNGIGIRIFNTNASNTNPWMLGTGGGVVPASSFSIGDASAYRLVINSSGNVGVGSTSPAATLDVNGTVKSVATSNASTTINFATGNLQYTSAACGAMVLNNMKSGTTYTLAVQGAAGGTCSFTAYTGVATGALTVKTGAASLVQTATKHALFTFLVMGSYVYVATADGY